MPMTADRRLGVGLALSLLLHGAVAGYAGSALLPPPAQPAGASVLAVTLRQTVPVAAPAPVPSPPVVSTPRPRPVAAVPPPQPAAPPPVPREPAPARRPAADVSPTHTPATPPRPAAVDRVEAPAAPAGPSMAAVRAHVLGEVKRRLAQHFRYPMLARRRGWEGEVLLGFTVDDSGRIADVRVARSSGYGALDEAARIALERVGRIPAPALRPAALELPVIYRLEG